VAEEVRDVQAPRVGVGNDATAIDSVRKKRVAEFFGDFGRRGNAGHSADQRIHAGDADSALFRVGSQVAQVST
jgi:hypothetical protein